MEFPSKLLENLVYNISQLSGIGKRSALRIALEILRKPKEYSRDLSESIFDFKTQIKHCSECHNISDKDICDICSNSSRDQSIICIVEDIRVLMAIENSMQYKGVYHVLGGLISPIDGIGPSEIKADELINRIKSNKVTEVIFALSTTMEGDTTNYYLFFMTIDI